MRHVGAHRFGQQPIHQVGDEQHDQRDEERLRQRAQVVAVGLQGVGELAVDREPPARGAESRKSRSKRLRSRRLSMLANEQGEAQERPP